MSPRTQAPAPLDSPSYWRRLMAAAHPDRSGGDGDLFVFLTAVREAVECGYPCGSCEPIIRHPEPRPESRPTSPPPADDKPRIPYPTGADFEEVTRTALQLAGTDETYGGVLSLLVDCYPLEDLAHEQERGASYKRLAAIAHT